MALRAGEARALSRLKTRTLLALILGAWAAGTLFMWMVATQNFAVVDRILDSQPAELQSLTANITGGQTREVLRYEASELNRLYFNVWGFAQLPLAGAALFLAWNAGRRLRIATLVLALICCGLQFYVVPETIRIGREIEFQPRQLQTPEQAQFWRLHGAYTSLDMLKFVVIAGCGVALVVRKKNPLKRSAGG